jgi:hypothetical protein
MTPAQLLLLPWHAARLATGAKAFCDNPVIGSRRLNARGLHAARVRLAYRLAERRRARLAAGMDAGDLAAFARDGFVERRDFLPADAFARLRDAVFAHAAPAREMGQGDAITRRIAIDPAMLRAVPEVAALIADPQWRALMRYVASFDVEPLHYVQSILTQRIAAPPDPQTHLHADTFHPTMKAWFFLTDVTAEDGPLTYVPGSHRLTPERLAWERAMSLKARDMDRLTARGSFRIEAAELPALGLPPARAFTVPANTLVVADTFGFHARGLSTRPATRVEIWAYSRRNPFLSWTGGDPLSLPGIAERRVPALWALRDRLEHLVGQPWRAVGYKRPADP